MEKNQYTCKNYNEVEINEIISLYKNGMSFTQISKQLNRQKNNIKKILIKYGVFIENRDNKKFHITDKISNEIIILYNNGESCKKIGEKYDISKTPINNFLKSKGLLRKGYSDGKKIILTRQQEIKLKEMYLLGNNSLFEISNELNLNVHFIDKILCNSNFRRTKGESISIRQKGKKHTKERVERSKITQQNIARSGKRKQKGGVCKFFNINGLKCQGTYEKYYIEKLIRCNLELPLKGETTSTPYGVYNSDFSKKNNLIEIKSDYTYDVLIGKKISRFSNKFETNQYRKIKWVNENVKPVEILVIDKRNDNIIKKEIL